MWHDVIYEPGELKAIGYKEGKPVGEAVVKTAGKPYAIQLTPDRNTINATGEDLSFVLVEAYDKNGNPCPLADNLINFKIDGAGEIAGVGNGDQKSYEPFQADYRKLFYGKAMLIVRSEKNIPGKIKIRAFSDSLKPSEIILISE
jgi:beta-galactosidase